jgi:hypothetical protein
MDNKHLVPISSNSNNNSNSNSNNSNNSNSNNELVIEEQKANEPVLGSRVSEPPKTKGGAEAFVGKRHKKHTRRHKKQKRTRRHRKH